MGNVNLRKIEAQGARKTKPGQVKHGVDLYKNTGRLPSGRSWKKTQREVSRIREALIEQYGGEKIQPSVLALIESAIEGLMIQRLSGLYVKKAGILRGDSLAKGAFELHPILCAQFISYANLVRLNLESAARLAQQKPPEGPVPTIAEIIREHDEAERAKERETPAEDQGAEEIGAQDAAQGEDQAAQGEGEAEAPAAAEGS